MRRLFLVLLADPAFDIVVDHIAQSGDMRVIIVQTWDIGEVLAARFFEAFLDLFVNLFQRFDAIR